MHLMSFINHRKSKTIFMSSLNSHVPMFIGTPCIVILSWHIFIILCGIKQLNKLRKKAFALNLDGNEMSFCHKFGSSNTYIFATQCRTPLIFQAIIYVGPNDIVLKYQRFTLSGCKDVGIRKLNFEGKTGLL